VVAEIHAAQPKDLAMHDGPALLFAGVPERHRDDG
jgi:hypothetical protein